MTRLEEYRSFRGMSFHQVEYHYWFPPVMPEDVARIRQAAYLQSSQCMELIEYDYLGKDPFISLPQESKAVYKQELQNFAQTYANRVFRHVWTKIRNDTKAAIGIGDAVYMDPYLPRVLIETQNQNSYGEYQWCETMDDLDSVMTQYFLAKQRLDRQQKKKDEYSHMTPKRAAQAWAIQTFEPALESYVWDIANFGDSNAFQDAELVLTKAAQFALDIGIDQGVEIQTPNGHTTFMLGVCFQDTQIGNTLKHASEHNGYINGIPMHQLSIPWGIFVE